MPGATGSAAGKPLLFIDGLNKPEANKRKQIRKYVMLGKNRGKSRNARAASTGESHRESQRALVESPDLVVEMRYSAVPNKVGDELSFTRFAAPVAPQLMRDILKCKLNLKSWPLLRMCLDSDQSRNTVSLMAKKVMYPLESCIEFHRKGRVDTFYFDLMTYDTTYLHAVAFSCQAFFNKASPRETAEMAQRSVVHHSAALKQLRERLSNEEERIKFSDSTVLVILCLAMHAHFTDDYDTAKHHMQGLHKIVDLRGGLRGFSYNTKLIMEILKCDLGIALFNHTEPFFFKDSSLEPMISYELASGTVESPDIPDSESWIPEWSINADVQRAWTVMREFCLTINSTTKRKRRLPKEMLLNTMASVMYRLLGMKGFDLHSPDEAIRLGLLAISSHTFLHFQNIKPPKKSFPQKYRDCLQNIEFSANMASIILWLLTIGAISVFTPTDNYWLMPLLRDQMRCFQITEWEDMRGHLERFLWINMLHDKPCQKVFSTAWAYENTS